MNIIDRLKRPEATNRSVGEGFSLLRHCTDSRLLAHCVSLQAIYPNITVRTGIGDRKRPSIHLLASGEVRRQRSIGQITLADAFRHLLNTVPSITRQMHIGITEIRAVRQHHSSEGLHYLQAYFSDASREALETESTEITRALESLSSTDDAEFRWSMLPDHMGIAALPAHTSPGRAKEMAQAATATLQIPLEQVRLSTVNCTIPGLGQSSW